MRKKRIEGGEGVSEELLNSLENEWLNALCILMKEVLATPHEDDYQQKIAWLNATMKTVLEIEVLLNQLSSSRDRQQ